jgi:DNA-binding NarL/FixJ family response regulator
VDDHPIVRQGLALLINQQEDMLVCGEAGNARDALASIGQTPPDLAIVDLSLTDVNGLDLIRQILSRRKNMPILVVSMHDETIYAERALRAGARGFIMKHEATEKVVSSIRRILKGEICLSERMASKMLEKAVGSGAAGLASPMELLSDRELEIFQLIGRGLQTKVIAEMLHLSIKTIETHRSHIKEKLKISNSSQLVRHAVHWTQSLTTRRSSDK